MFPQKNRKSIKRQYPGVKKHNKKRLINKCWKALVEIDDKQM